MGVGSEYCGATGGGGGQVRVGGGLAFDEMDIWHKLGHFGRSGCNWKHAVNSVMH